jgi:hypothetical protein
MPTEKTIRSFWNRAAEENPHWYVSSYGSYDADRNLDEFWDEKAKKIPNPCRDGRASLRRSASSSTARCNTFVYQQERVNDMKGVSVVRGRRIPRKA